ncbi:hypothetical protein I6G76_29850 (plasmid) [Bacillus cereus]|uniref:Uncharacterized protein n=1 Tax=Bacillus cereus (strain ZK / E33L) TaxID=288681 RepID=Q4V0X4_BACCZ|nr:hypothetical protein [Bacillus cereus]AAY60633.1 hypothetical protein pE33L54_0027 [Bacillus cereus E33L]AJI25883.1 hypothetical protein BF28_5980 [Bacillus cereus E33L]QQA24546.1 hypothetical protein I6G76_29850 [Bacillus cereus]
MKKVLSVMGSLVFAMTVLFGFGGTASANSFGWTYFETEDGRWDGNAITTTYSQPNVEVHLGVDGRAPYKIGGTRVDGQTLRVRLCNPVTKACTSYQYFGGSEGLYSTIVTGMKPATYRIDIIDPFSSYRVKGYVEAATFSW